MSNDDAWDCEVDLIRRNAIITGFGLGAFEILLGISDGLAVRNLPYLIGAVAVFLLASRPNIVRLGELNRAARLDR
ncbi:MAG: hypothetical protein WDM91_08725 [Rhizomicrobium sp.]